MKNDPLSPTETTREEERPDAFDAVLFGAAVACASSFIPYLVLTMIGPTILGTVAAVWWRARRQKAVISAGRAALLALGATLLGGLCYTAIYDLLWMWFDYRHGAQQEEAATLAFAEWLGGAEGREAAQVELIASRHFSVVQLLLQILGVSLVSGLVAPAVGAFTAFLLKSEGNTKT